MEKNILVSAPSWFHHLIKTKEDRDSAEHNLLDNFVRLLTNVGFLVDHLTDFGKSKYMGFCMFYI